jgi:hypothetical protein
VVGTSIRNLGIVVGAVLLSGLVAAGCGDSSDAAPTLTKAQLAARHEFVARANRLCGRARIKGERKGVGVLRSKARYYERQGSLKQYLGSIKRQEIAIVLAPSLHRRVGEIRRLGIPPRDRVRVERILAEIKDVAETAAENPFGFLTGESTIGRARDLARAYGIESCAVLYDPEGIFQRASASPATRLTPRSSK